jgi:ATP-binding protein
MKTIKQIKQLVEIFSTNSDSTSNNSLLTSVRDNYIPLFQFNIEAFSSEKAQLVFEKIGKNVSRRTSVPYLPDGLHTKDQIGIQTFETPTIMEWMGGQSGQNFVINYSNKSANKAEARLNQLVVDMLLSLPSRSINIHFVDLTFSAQASFLTRNLDEKIYGKLISSSNDWNHLKDSLREKMAKALEEYGDVAKYNDSKNRVVVPYDVVVINDYQKCVNEMSDLDALFENGHKGGIYFILMNNLDFKSDRDIDSLMALKDFYQVLEAENFGNYSKDAFIRCTPILDNPILAKACFNYINEGAELPQVAVTSVDYDKILSKGFETIDKAMVIPVGSSENGELVDFTIDTVSHIHCFIIGQSGTGKSVFLHDVIIGAMAKYSPDELELYLMDFKIGGVEFNRYRNEKHVKALLVDNSDIQITLEILRDISNKMRERGKQLRASGVSNIVEYNQVNPTKKMPRIVFIADECHVMFPTMNSKDTKLYREISEILQKIAKEGRSQGVHLVLATQTIAQAEISSEILNNISDFYLLKCSPSDSERLVRGSVDTTSGLKTGQVLHHDIDHDVVFKSTYLPTSQTLEIIKKINDKTKASKNEQFYFVGSQIFEIDDEVKNLLTEKGDAIAFGRSIDTKMEPVVIPLRNEYADNVMLFGINDEEQVSRTTMASIKSLRISNKNIKIKVINCLSAEQRNTTKMLNDWENKGEIELLNPQNCGGELVNIANSIMERTAEPTVLYILGQERFRELRMDMEIAFTKPTVAADDFGFDSSMFTAGDSGSMNFNSYQKAIEYILKNGAEVGVHVILQIDKPKQLLFSDYMSAKDFFNMFHHLIMLKSDENAVNSLGMSDDLKLENLSSDIERLRAIYYNETNNSYTLFTPFDF